MASTANLALAATSGTRHQRHRESRGVTPAIRPARLSPTVLGVATLILGSAAWSDEASIMAIMRERLPDLTVHEVRSTPVDGVYAVETENDHTSKTVHAIGGGSHVIVGDLFALAPDGPINLTEERRRARRRHLLSAVEPTDVIQYIPADAVHVLTVFTDVDCPYCRQFHEQLGTLHGYGIGVRYLAFPMAGEGSATWRRMISAWCADDPRTALSRLKEGESIPPATCADPVAQHYELASALGAKGTPTLFTETGQRLSGYRPAAELAKTLGVLASSPE